MVYVGGESVVEAITSGVLQRPLNDSLGDATLAIVLRRRHLTSNQANAVIQHASNYARKRLPYDSVGAAGSGVTTRRGGVLAAIACSVSRVACGIGASEVMQNALPQNADRAFFCSELVARVFELAGAPITDGSASFVTPRDVRVSDQLYYIRHLIDA